MSTAAVLTVSHVPCFLQWGRLVEREKAVAVTVVTTECPSLACAVSNPCKSPAGQVAVSEGRKRHHRQERDGGPAVGSPGNACRGPGSCEQKRQKGSLSLTHFLPRDPQFQPRDWRQMCLAQDGSQPGGTGGNPAQ